MESVPLRRCTACGLEKPWTLDFYAAKGASLRGTCRQCKAARKRMIYRETHHDRFAQQELRIELAAQGRLRCRSCRQDLEATDEHFYRDKRRGVLDAECKACHLKRTNASRKQALNDEVRGPILRAKARAWQAEYRQISPLKVKKAWQQWYSVNAEQVRAARRTEEGRARARAHRSKYARLYPERVAASNARTKAIRLQAEGQYTGHDVLKCFRLQEGCCYYCNIKVGGKGARWQVDHVIPLSRGGTNLPENIVVACESCNRKKYNFMPWEFMPERFGSPA